MRTDHFSISIITLTKNRSAFLNLCLQSLKGQLKKSDEIIILNNNSSDNTESVIKHWKKFLPIHEFKTHNEGYPRLYNEAVSKASKTILVFLDDDCIADSNFVANIRSAHRKFPNSAIQGITYSLPKDNIYAEIMGSHYQNWLKAHTIFENQLKTFDNKNLSLPTSIFVNYKGYREDLNLGSEDIELGIRMRQGGIKIYFEPSIVAFHHERATLQGFIQQHWRIAQSEGKLDSNLSKEFRMQMFNTRVKYHLVSLVSTSFSLLKKRRLLDLFLLPFLYISLLFIRVVGYIKGKNILKTSIIPVLTVFFVTSLSLSFFFKTGSVPKWSKFTVDGGVTNQPYFYKNQIIFNTSQQGLLATDKKTGSKQWSYKTQANVSSSLANYKDILFFISADNVLHAIHSKNGEELWRYEQQDFYNITFGPMVSNGIVLLSNSNGTIFAFNANSGKKLWEFHTPEIKDLSTININTYLNWAGTILVKDKMVFYGSRDGSLYALSIKDGIKKWEIKTSSSSTMLSDIRRKNIFLANKNGDIIGVDTTKGSILWKETGSGTPSTCVQYLTSLDFIHDPINNEFTHTIIRWLNSLNIWNTYVVQITQNGKIVMRNGKNGSMLWQKETNRTDVTCPSVWSNYLYFADKEGVITAIDRKTGTIWWENKTGGSVYYSPEVSYQSFTKNDSKKHFLFDTPLLYFGNSNGTFFALNGKNGHVEWKYETTMEIYEGPIIEKDQLYFSSSNGSIYRVNKASGKIDPPYYKDPITHHEEFQEFESSNVYEITFTQNDKWYKNPWTEVLIKTKFVHENGDLIRISGFYYDKNTWKVRFNPPKKGNWKWTSEIVTPYETKKLSGEFTSKTDTERSYTKISKLNKNRLTLDGSHIFNGIGLGDVIGDTNSNGNPFDDWAIGDSNVETATSSAGVTFRYRSNKIIKPETYFETYASQGNGMNLYRWSIGNATFSLWKDLYSGEFLVHEGKMGDFFVQQLKKHDYNIWLTLFVWEIPFDPVTFDNNMWPNEKKALQQYIQYIVARYGAYTSIWEIANEAHATQKGITFVANEIRKNDFELRPISMSFEEPVSENIDIISPHWYEPNDTQFSDLNMVEMIEKYKKYNRPIIFGEHGNRETSWDKDSALRMRVRAWVSFIKGAMLIFWNQSDDKTFHSPMYGNGNIFLGDEERKYIEILQRYTKNISLQSTDLEIPANNTEVRSYGLSTDSEILGYFYHFTNQNTLTSVNISFTLQKKGSVEWIDPETGEVVQRQIVNSGIVNISSPSFLKDSVVKISFIES